jgi:molybdopterin converting factor small subunit
MKVELRLFASLRKYGPPQEEMELAEGTTVGELLERVGIPPSEVAIALVNGRHAPNELPLNDGETLAFFPPIAGG